MDWVKARTWIAAAVVLAAAGCSTAAPTSNTVTNGGSTPDRSITAAQPQPQMSFEQLASQLPKRLTNDEASKLLVTLPGDQVKGPLVPEQGRSTQQWWGWGGRYRYYGLGGYYYPYYYYGSYWYPYSYYSLGSWYYPYYYSPYAYGYSLYGYWPYSYRRYSRFWW